MHVKKLDHPMQCLRLTWICAGEKVFFVYVTFNDCKNRFFWSIYFFILFNTVFTCEQPAATNNPTLIYELQIRILTTLRITNPSPIYFLKNVETKIKLQQRGFSISWSDSDGHLYYQIYDITYTLSASTH